MTKLIFMYEGPPQKKILIHPPPFPTKNISFNITKLTLVYEGPISNNKEIK